MMDYFAEIEFSRCVPSCSKSDMDKAFLARLNHAREIAGIPFILNCAYRSVERELSKNRSGKGYHTLGRAVDIRCVKSSSRAIIVASLLAAGFNGIGVARSFIHVDDRPIKTMWLYE